MSIHFYRPYLLDPNKNLWFSSNRAMRNSISEIIKYNRPDAVALCSVGNLFDLHQFYDLCKEYEVKPILGMEIYLQIKEEKQHLTLLAKNKAGYKSLMQIATALHSQKSSEELPWIDESTLEKHKEGVLLISKEKIELKNQFQSDFYIKELTAESERGILTKIEQYDIHENREFSLIPIPKKFASSFEYLEFLVYQGAHKRYGENLPEIVIKQLEYEFEIIKTKEFSNYILFYWDFIQSLQEKDIVYTTESDATASSIVNYVLGITTFDPIKYKLLPERFMFLTSDYPKIDIYFASVDREKAIKELVHKYGTEQIAKIIRIDLNHGLKINASGIIVSGDSLSSQLPLIKLKEEKLSLSQYNKEAVDDLGIFTMNFLGLRTLSILKKCVSEIKTTQGMTVDLNKIPLNDENVLQLFSNGDTDGVFQFESDKIKDDLRKLQPNSFHDLIVLNALSRPGLSGVIPEYIALKRNKNKIKYIHPLEANVLKETQGILVFQEQMMQMAKDLAGFNGQQAEDLRKAMEKKKSNELLRLKADFISGCKNNPQFIDGCNDKNADELIESIWQHWAEESKFIFNKSHAVSYTLIAYQCAYLKAHFPEEFRKSREAFPAKMD